jgi:DNA-directed RNA polymerase subunit RPC12/RpoP
VGEVFGATTSFRCTWCASRRLVRRAGARSGSRGAG